MTAEVAATTPTSGEIPQEIERTRAELSRDVDALYDKVAPGRVIGRRKDAVRGKLGSMRDTVMGTAGSAGGAAGSTASHVAHSATDAAQALPGAVQDGAHSVVHTAERRVEGSPLGAGLLAFGAGLVVAALLPASEREAAVAGRVSEAVKDSPLADQAAQAARDVGEEVRAAAADAAQEVKAGAQDAAGQVADEGRSAAAHVREDAPLG
ncbi:DUF3618 domain-containing protein [Nocardioides sp.]|uniref:DUF3618 domain-containing protein n=1 Tax=Nocardioides sp. TaxID=35761 RepID=UPI0035120B1E